jgi:cholesterol transport system auxiliary component
MLFLSVTFAGCGGLFHSNTRPEQIYYLRATPIQGLTAIEPVKASLRFNRPAVNPGLDSAQIVLVQSDRRMSFYVGSRWPAPASSVIEALAVEKLRRSGLWRSVSDSTSSFPSDYVLQVTIRHFEAEYTDGGAAPDVRVVLDCLIDKQQDREVIASFLAEGSAKAAANRLGAVVAAFETAANTALDSLSTKAAHAAIEHQATVNAAAARE